MQNITELVSRSISKINLPDIGVIDIIEIALISFFIYQFMVWIKFTRAYTLLKGILVVLVFLLLAYIFKMNTILWIVSNLASALITGVIVIFQPELRKVLEQIGEKKIMSAILPFDTGKDVQERFTDRTVNELIKACYDMGEVKTGALIVIEQNILLTEYERTGINIDAVLSSQLLINIFEHNTPLHDGAVIVRGNRVVAATCYLPLSDNMELSKQLGTRHRAGVGISEVSDSLTIIVSEETGKVSAAQGGRLMRDVSSTRLRELLEVAQNKKVVENSKLRHLLKGRVKHEEKKVNR
ncbi:MAG TPA: diadenylate cyclase CdaA [Candidatus Blautia faecigallinarum]|uniref:Diadenylate cyclase n=1 Tax=Candidatus Blautia faecigallinarum TaxID=2838488 RepID=A0A9D2DTE5_9FIRM|nr:diadenylate cyclase CdaA [Candidatus Blautia faecigallinarum]